MGGHLGWRGEWKGYSDSRALRAVAIVPVGSPLIPPGAYGWSWVPLGPERKLRMGEGEIGRVNKVGHCVLVVLCMGR